MFDILINFYYFCKRETNFLIYRNTILRGRAEAARRAHNPEVAGSSPVPATKRKMKIYLVV